jgi:hypothetical protein
VDGADWYRVYLPGEQEPRTATSSRYPSYPGTMDVHLDDVFRVTACNWLETGEKTCDYESEPWSVTEAGCYLNAGEVNVTYYLHSNPTPPDYHTNSELPFFMTEEKPIRPFLYNYNDPENDPAKPGREVLKSGGTPPGEADPERYIEWRTAWNREEPEYQVPLRITTGVTVTLWVKNPANQPVMGTAYLYELNSSGYNWIAQTTHTWPAGVSEWQETELVFRVSDLPIGDRSQLVVWVISDNTKSLHFAYDTTDYRSRIEFTGRWYSE